MGADKPSYLRTLSDGTPDEQLAALWAIRRGLALSEHDRDIFRAARACVGSSHNDVRWQSLRGCTAKKKSVNCWGAVLWEEIMPDLKMQRCNPYSSDMTDEQWAIAEPFLQPNAGRGRRQTHPLREVVNAIFYLNTNGCKWRDLPRDFPPPTTVSYHYCKWARDGTWEKINGALREAVRVDAGRDPLPSEASVDSQTTKAAATGGDRGYDGAKKTTGRKRHILVDSMGLLIAAAVTAGCVSDASGAAAVFRGLPWPEQHRLGVVYADSAYHRDWLRDLVAERMWFELRIVRRLAGDVGFVILPKRWVVERTFGWLAHFRRHARDYERSYDSSEAHIYISSVQLMLRRLTKKPKHINSGRGVMPRNARKIA